MILSQIQGLQNNIFKRRDLSYYLRVLVAGCRLLVTGCWLLVTGSMVLVPSTKHQETSTR